jgi:ketosteroid isomerase-like protein
MKRLLIPATTILFCFFSFNAYSQQEVKQVKNQNSDQPYKVQATKITIGNPAYTQKVLWAWKYYDENTLDKISDLFTDDVVATLPDGTSIKGKDNFLKAMKDYRNTFTSVVSEVAACTTLKTPDDPEHEVVSIWGMETDTHKDGTVTKVHLNEVWFFNKQGKVAEFHQLAAQDAPQKN